MRFSIVIINKNDVGIDSTLLYLKKVIRLKYVEVIVVDASDHKLDWIKKKYPFVKWISYRTKIEKISIPEQRNVGINHARGDIIVFLDASCVPDRPDWLTEITAPILKEGELIVRGSLSNTKNYVTIVLDQGSNQYVTESPTINMAVHVSVFNQIGIFDESFSYGSDMDFSWRATKSGLNIRYIRSAPVAHDFGNTKQNFKRYFQYGMARARLYIKHPQYISRIRNYELKSLIYLAIFCSTPLALLYPAYIFIPGTLILIQFPGNPLKETIERVAFSIGWLFGFYNALVEKKS